MGEDAITRKRGDDYDETFAVKDADGAAVDITGATISFTVKDRFSDAQASAILKKTSASAAELEITNGAGGLFTVHFTTAEMRALELGEYAYDVEVLLSGGKTHTPAQDLFIIVGDVTTY